MIQLMLLLTAFLSLLLGWIIYLNNSKRPINKFYGFFTLASSTWLICNALTMSGNSFFIAPESLRLSASRLITFTSLMTLFTLYVFILEFHGLLKRKTYPKTLLALIISVSLLAFSDNLGVSIAQGGESFNIGPFYYLYLCVLAIEIILIVKYLLGSASLSEKKYYESQKNLIRRGFLYTIIPTVLFGAILPIFVSYSWLLDIAPLFSIVFIFYAALAIVRYSLFDIRPLALRTLGYTISLFIITALFIVTIVLFGRATLLDQLNNQSLIFISVLMLIFAALYRPLQQSFDKLTSNIFFKDTYNSQLIISKLNSILVSIDTTSNLIDKATELIAEDLKLANCSVYLTKINEFTKADSLNTKNWLPNKPGWAKLIGYLDDQDDIYIVAGDTLNNPWTETFLKDHKLGMIIKMSSGNELIGYLVAGEKKSGNAFVEQDVQLLLAATNSIAIASQNTMRYEEISMFATTLQSKVDAATLQLQKSNEKLKALDSAKDEFISMASHQLRTPLTSVKGYISMILEGDAGEINDLQKKFLNQAFISSQRMVYLISDLLNVSRLKTGKFVIENRETYLPDTVEDELRQLDETIKARGLSIEYKKPKKFPIVVIDEDKIRQVIMNFADNAIYYTPAGGKITVDLKATDKTLEYTVKDSGIGVPRHEQHHLFTKFYRAGNARKARPDGTGLGLFMAKKVITAQGGSILFNSEEGKGSTFGFTLPLSKVEKPQ